MLEIKANLSGLPLFLCFILIDNILDFINWSLTLEISLLS